jgi:hypothetical protein
MNPLYIVPIIAALAGHPEVASVASYVISAVSHESTSTDDGVDRLVAMSFKNGLSDLQLYEEAPASEKIRHARDAQNAFISAANVEKDMIRVARAELYVSATSKLLGEDRIAVDWAQRAYRDLSAAEVLAWRIFGATKENVPLVLHKSYTGVAFLEPPCGGAPQLKPMSALLKAGGRDTFFFEDYRLGKAVRVAKLKEIYAYKTALAAYLRGIHSPIKELNDPVTVPLDDYQRGAEVAVRLSCELRAPS